MSRTAVFPLRDYNLAATLTSGQAFRWREANGPVIEWENIIAGRWVRLSVKDKTLHAQTAKPQKDWQWLTDYLQLEVNLKKILGGDTSFIPENKYIEIPFLFVTKENVEEFWAKKKKVMAELGKSK